MVDGVVMKDGLLMYTHPSVPSVALGFANTRAPAVNAERSVSDERRVIAFSPTHSAPAVGPKPPAWGGYTPAVLQM